MKRPSELVNFCQSEQVNECGDGERGGRGGGGQKKTKTVRQ